jgi:hypothetical protein
MDVEVRVLSWAPDFKKIYFKNNAISEIVLLQSTPITTYLTIFDFWT